MALKPEYTDENPTLQEDDGAISIGEAANRVLSGLTDE